MKGENGHATQEEWKGLREAFKDEWNRRTWYGKLWFPLWATFKLLVIFSVLAVAISLSPRTAVGHFGKFIWGHIGPQIKRSISAVRGLTPEVHNDAE